MGYRTTAKLAVAGGARITLTDLFRLLAEARRLSSHDDFVVVGSLSILGLEQETILPEDMAMSLDLDCYTKNDPARIFDLIQQLGEGSPYEKEHSYFLDPVSPNLPTLPDGWQARLLKITRDHVTAWFLDPNDAAISTYERGEPRDVRWIRAGITAGIVSMPIVGYRLRETLFLDDEEAGATQARYASDIRWLAEKSAPADG